MYYEEIPCPDYSSLNIVKNGKNAQQKHRYLCKDCRRQFIRAYTYLGCNEAVRALIVPLTMNGAGSRDIERVLLVSRHTVLATLRTAAAQVAAARGEGLPEVRLSFLRAIGSAARAAA